MNTLLHEELTKALHSVSFSIEGLQSALMTTNNRFAHLAIERAIYKATELKHALNSLCYSAQGEGEE